MISQSWSQFATFVCVLLYIGLVIQRWDIMQDKLRERAAARDRAMSLICKMDEVYDELQAISRKQALVRKTDQKLRLVISGSVILM